MDSAQCVKLKASLLEMIDPEKDSIRLYYLGNNHKTKVEHIGVDRGMDLEGTLIL